MTIPSDIIKSLHVVSKANGAFKSMEQRKYLVSKLTEFALETKTLGSLSSSGEFVAEAREYVVKDDRGIAWAFTLFVAEAREYVVKDDRGIAWAFTCHRTKTAVDSGALTRRRFGKEWEAPAAGDNAPSTGPAHANGPIVSLALREELRELVAWGPSSLVWVAPSADAVHALETIAKMSQAALLQNFSREDSTKAWKPEELEHITRVQIAAKGLLCDIGDNAGQSAVAMTPEDAQYVSQMLTEGHIRNAHWFKRKSMSQKALRAACVVNGAKMDPGTRALAERMVALMNDEARRLGRPVGFSEYTAIMTGEEAA